MRSPQLLFTVSLLLLTTGGFAQDTDSLYLTQSHGHQVKSARIIDRHPVISVPGSDLDWQKDAVSRAKILTSVKWTPVAATMPNRKGGYFEKGKEYTGVPYSSVRQVGRYIGFDISLRTFLAAVENPESVLYTRSLVGELSNAAAFYGAVCSSYTSYALQCGVPEVSRHHGPDYSDGVILVDPLSVTTVQIGDVIYTPPARERGGSHVEMVTDLRKDADGKVTSILIEESRPPTTHSTWRDIDEFLDHLKDKNRELYRITDLDRWRGGNRAEQLHFPNPELDSRMPRINRALLLDLGDWVVYQLGDPVKFNIMDRDQLGVSALLIHRNGALLEEVPLDEPIILTRTFAEVGDYTAQVVHADGSLSSPCHFAVCDLDYTLPEDPVSISGDWSISFSFENMRIVAINLFSLSDSYGRHPVFLTEKEQKAGKLTVPAGLLKKPGRLQVWLIGEHPLGRLKQVRTISMVE